MDFTRLGEYGIDCKKGVARCLDDWDFYAMVLNLFLNDDTLDRAHKALANGNRTELFHCMHELKGACGNAELTDLYGAVHPLVELLRRDGGTDEEIQQLFARVERAYDRAKEGIRLADGK